MQKSLEFLSLPMRQPVGKMRTLSWRKSVHGCRWELFLFASFVCSSDNRLFVLWYCCAQSSDLHYEIVKKINSRAASELDFQTLMRAYNYIVREGICR